VLEADLIGFGDHEVWCDEAVPGAEYGPGIAEALGVLAIESGRCAGVGLGSWNRSALWVVIPDLASTAWDHNEPYPNRRGADSLPGSPCAA
jgi:hypothetical protein